MRHFKLNSLLGTLALLSFCPESHSMDHTQLDINSKIKQNATLRNQQFWTPLEQNHHTLGIGHNVNLSKRIIVDNSRNNLTQAIYRPSHQKDNKGQAVSTAIPYILCASEDVTKGLTAPKGVIIKVYGAGHPLDVQNNNSLSEEKLWAAQGYIVYCLNLRGTEGFGNTFLHAQNQSHAVQSLVRDISYFTYLLKNQKQDHLGTKALGSQFIDGSLPFYLTGASFGGYLTLCHATNWEDNFYVKQFNTTISHRRLFDGYISSMPVTDLWRDAKSGTQAANTRLPFFTQQNSQFSWMKNAFEGKNVVDNDADNKELSPLHHMDRVEKPILFLHGGQDTNVSPKQTVDCIKEAIKQGKQDKVFLYFDGSLGHNYTSSTQATKEYYEMIFRFMDGASLATKNNGARFSSPDNLSSINSLVHLRTRALNPDVNRPAYHFLHQAVSTFHNGKMHKNNFDSSWQHLKENHSTLFLKALIWKAEKEKITFDRQNKRNYLAQKEQLKSNYLVKLGELNIPRTSSNVPLSQYLSTTQPVQGTSSCTTNQQLLLNYLGNNNTNVGMQKFQAYEGQLKHDLQEIIKNHRLGLVVTATTLSTRLGV